jgi:ABC-type uncharacterized transport system involved in gliding motility auxiliary subunit
LTGVIIGNGTPAENQPAPRSDDPATPAANTGTDKNPPAEDPNELKTIGSDASADANAPPDPNELKPNVAPDTPAPAPTQVNEVQNGANAQTPANATTASDQELADDQMISSSKHKKKKGLGKIIPGGK